MPRPKSSEAQVFSLRLNPIHPQEEKLIGIIEGWKEQGYDFKTLVSDRIFRAEGVKPESYSVERILPEMMANALEPLLERFAEHIIQQLHTAGVTNSSSEQEYGEAPSQLAKNFARSFVQRQRKALNEDEE